VRRFPASLRRLRLARQWTADAKTKRQVIGMLRRNRFRRSRPAEKDTAVLMHTFFRKTHCTTICPMPAHTPPMEQRRSSSDFLTLGLLAIESEAIRGSQVSRENRK